MAITIVANEREFEFPDGTTQEQMGSAIDEFFTGDQVPAQAQQTPQEESFLDASVGTAQALIQGGAVEVGAGISGILEGAMQGDMGAGAQEVERFRQAHAAQTTPRTAAQLQDIGSAVGEFTEKVITPPLAGISGLTTLAETGSIDESVSAIQDVTDKGFIKASADRTMAETGSPALAAGTEAALSVLPDILALKGITMLPKEARRLAAQDIMGKGDISEIAVDLFNTQSKTKQRIGRLIEEGSTNKEVAIFDLKDGLEVDNAIGSFNEAIRIGAPKIKKDKLAIETIKQGFDDGVIAALKGSTPIAKKKMLAMVGTMKKVKQNKLFGMENRPSDIAGDSLMERVNFVYKENRQAGRDLEKEARSLRGQPVEFNTAVDSFIRDMEDMGVTLEGTSFKPNFRGSDIEGSAGAENVISRVVERMAKNFKDPDAYELHRLKKYIDEQVTFGKTTEGLTGKSERVLKKLRANIDGILDKNFPEYDRVNTIYADTINAIDSFQSDAGRKMNLTGDNADKAVGTLLRRLMGNAQSRVNIMDSINNLEAVSRKYGADFDDDLLTQVLFADELDAVFGSVQRTSFRSDIVQAGKDAAKATATQQGAVDLLLKGAAATANKFKGVNQENAFKAIEELLKK